MKVIIAGSRHITNPAIPPLSEWKWPVTEVVCGEARGVDAAGRAWAERHGIPVKSFPADWNRHGRAAGPVRNEQMANYADALVAFWDGESRGTHHMIETMRLRGKKVHVIPCPTPAPARRTDGPNTPADTAPAP